MNIQALNTIAALGLHTRIKTDISNIKLVGSQMFVNGYTALPVYHIETHVYSTCDIEVKDEGEDILGLLCVFDKSDPYLVASMTEAQFIAFLFDTSLSHFETIEDDEEDYCFNCSYLVIEEDMYGLYMNNYFHSAPLWGGFSHEKRVRPFEKEVREIRAVGDVIYPTSTHQKKIVKGPGSSDGFETYLRYYHQLELLFDLITVFKIKQIDNSLRDFSSIIKQYEKAESHKLKVMILSYVTQIETLQEIINAAGNYLNIAKEIFEDYGKDHNPIKEQQHKDIFYNLIATHSLSKSAAISSKLVKSDKAYETLILEISSYWIYRFRCAIAHNKIGEFIFDDADEEFVVEVGLRMVKNVIANIFANHELYRLAHQ